MSLSKVQSTRPARRRILRGVSFTSRFRVGMLVLVDGGYEGTVIKTENRITKTVDAYTDETATRPGVIVRVTKWNGMDISSNEMLIEAWDSETARRTS